MAKRKRSARKTTSRIPTDVPPYTQSLDAAIPGENIIAVQFDEASHKWIAINRSVNAALSVGVGNTEALARRVAALKAIRERDKRASSSADRVVGLEHSRPEFSLLIETLDKLTEAIEQNNEYAAKAPEDRRRRLLEVRSVRELLTSRHAFFTSAVLLATSTLTYLATKFADAAIGKLADAAFTLLQKLLGS